MKTYEWIVISACLVVAGLGCDESEEQSAVPQETTTAEPEEVETIEEHSESRQATQTAAPTKTATTIELGVRVGPVAIGMEMKEVRKLLGKPDSESDLSLLYAEEGIKVVSKDGVKVMNIVCFSEVQGLPNAQPCQYKTTEGIGIGSSRAEVIEAYGAPSHERSGRLVYKDLRSVFSMEDDRVVRILTQ